MSLRTDSHNNPTAFTTDIAHEAGLVLGIDYSRGDPFQAGTATYYTARITGDPVATTIRVIDTIGYYTRAGWPRWSYIALPKFDWDAKTFEQKRDIIGFHYQREGGLAMRDLFPNYGKL